MSTKMFSKIFAIIIAVCMAFTCIVACFAVDAKKSPSTEDTKPTSDGSISLKVTLNGKPSNDVKCFIKDPSNPDVYTFEYTGNGIFKGLHIFVDGVELVEGVDYVILIQDGKVIVVRMITLKDGQEFWINAVIEDEENAQGETSSGQKQEDSDIPLSPKTGALSITNTDIIVVLCGVILSLILLLVNKSKNNNKNEDI